jgi:hypothetical protein
MSDGKARDRYDRPIYQACRYIRPADTCSSGVTDNAVDVINPLFTVPGLLAVVRLATAA